MEKHQVFHIHGGEAFDSYDAYLEYLKTAPIDPHREEIKRWAAQLPETLGDSFEVIAPRMPSKYNAHYAEWELWFSRHYEFMRDPVILIGHSLGANFLAKYLATETLPVRVKSLHLVAGCAGSPGGFELPASLAGVEEQAEKIYVYHSADDPVVPFDDMETYLLLLPTAEEVVFEDRGHFLQEEFPELVERIREE